MKIKSEKGYTGIDIAVSVVVLFIFVSLIAVLSYNFNSSSKEIELKSKAMEIAIDEIEKIKNQGFTGEIEAFRKTEENQGIFKAQEEVQEGFFRTIMVEDYADIYPNKILGLVKRITVQIQYKFKKEIETVELSTILSKEI